MPDFPLSRRSLLQGAAATGALAGLHATAGFAAPRRPAGANDAVKIGVIGVGGRARQLISQLPDDARVVAVADCYAARTDQAKAEADANWPAYGDYRRMLDTESLDAVIVATPDHGRTRPCVHACQAGLDVYAEKPLTAYVSEGRALVDAVRKYDRVCQVGTQQRTMELNEYCCRFVREGGLGPLKVVRAVKYPGPRTYDGLPEEPVPEGDDWDMWCGPTPLRPFNPALQFGWMQWRAYSGGETTNWGAHGVDQIQWALGKSLSGPREIAPLTPGQDGAVRLVYEEVAPALSADGRVEVRFDLEKGPMGGAVFTGEKAKLEVNRNRFASNPAGFLTGAPDPAVREKWELPGWIAGPHLANWIDCIRSRERPNADVEVGHRSITVCHLVNIARELGRPLRWDPAAERFEDDAAANALLTRERRAGYELPG